MGNPKEQFHWDNRLIEFLETIEYHGHKKILHILRGPGFHGEGRGGIKQFDWSTWNLPLPSHFARHKNVSGYTTENGIHATLLKGFLEICSLEKSSVSPIIDNPVSKIIPVAMQVDGMAIKPGLIFDRRQGILVGGTRKIDNEFIEENPSPSPDDLKSLFAQEAEVTCITSLDNKLTLPVGVDYIAKGGSAVDTLKKITRHSIQLQTCLQCLKSVPLDNGVIKETSCFSECKNCLELGDVCETCEQAGQLYVEPALRRCEHCLKQGHKCIKLLVLVMATDSESKNKTAKEMFEESKTNGKCSSYLNLASCVPDGVHVGKRLARQFSNWFLIVDGYRINRVILRTLRGDPLLKDKLRPYLSVASCRNRDRMDVDASLEISSKPVRDIISKVKTITHTIIPEKYRIYEDNKKGIISAPIALCKMENGNLLLVDAQKGKLFSIRLHYPVDVVEVTNKLKHPVAISYIEDVVYISDIAEKVINYLDLKSESVYDPCRMTVKQLQTALKKIGLWQNEYNKLKKGDLQEKLQKWIDDNSENTINGQGQTQSQKIGKLKIHNLEEVVPSALCAVGKKLIVADLCNGNIYFMDLYSNGISISASVRQTITTSIPSIHCATQKDNYVYMASSDEENGGIFSIEVKGEVLDSTVSKLKSNGTAELKQAFGISAHTSKDSILISDIKDKKVKVLSDLQNQNILRDFVGNGSTGNKDGIEANFQQPAGLCVEQNTVFVTDIATGTVKIVIDSAPLVQFLEMLHTFHHSIDVTLNDKKTTDEFQERITYLEGVHNYILKCNAQIKSATGTTKTLQGPEGACTAQSISDLEMMIQCMKNVLSFIRKYQPNYEEKLHIKSFLTLVVENLFSEMRQGNDMPLVLQFCQKFQFCTRELLKRITSCSFIYYTGRPSYYHLTKTVNDSKINFNDISKMGLPEKKKLTSSQQTNLKTWCTEFGRSVRQNTVRGLTTKDKPGTLPLACYETENTKVNTIDISNLGECLKKDKQIKQLQQKKVVLPKKTIVFKRINNKLTLAKLCENVLETDGELQNVKCVIYHEDILHPLTFVSGNTDFMNSNEILGSIDSDDFTEQNDTITLSYEFYESTKSDKDIATADEIEEEVQESTEALQRESDCVRRSRRNRHTNVNPDFLYI